MRWAVVFIAVPVVAACYAIVGITGLSGEPADATADGGTDATGDGGNDATAADGGTCTRDLLLGQCAHPCSPPTQCVAGYCLTPYYMSPDGSDDASGQTPETAMKSFNRVIPSIFQGKALVLLDGTYEPTTTGMLQAACVGRNPNANNGASDQPIVVVAQNERMAVLQSDGQESAVSIVGCNHWVVQGLTATSKNAPVDGGTLFNAPHTVSVVNAQYVDLRRMLVQGNNAVYASAGMSLYNASYGHVVESEIYDFVNDGLSVNGPAQAGPVEVERVYINPRVYAGTPGQHGVGCYGGTVLLENVVTEGASTGFYELTFTGALSVSLLGSLALGTPQGLDVRLGFLFVRDFAAINGADAGQTGMSLTVNADAGAGASIFNVSLFHTGGAQLGSGGGTVVNLDSAEGYGTGINVLAPTAWRIESSNSFAPIPYAPPLDAGPYQQCANADPAIDVAPLCLVYVPPGSPMFDAGADGSIGANIVYRYEDGGLTTTGLWACHTFPCGALSPGINDQVDAGTCSNLAARLNLGEGGCPLPDGAF
jgi:hypothetical protein